MSHRGKDDRVQQASEAEGMETCDFCGRHDVFDKVDCARLFASDTPAAAAMPASEAKH